jgi:hypothetical protein
MQSKKINTALCSDRSTECPMHGTLVGAGVHMCPFLCAGTFPLFGIGGTCQAVREGGPDMVEALGEVLETGACIE